jgi:hypothetical protein
MSTGEEGDFKRSMHEWVAIKKQLKEVRKDVGVLNKREKELKTYIEQYMKSHDIDTCNAQGSRVTYTQRKVKGSFTKAIVKKGLTQFFNGNEDQADRVMEIIESCIQVGHKDSISIRIKEDGLE